MMNELEKEIMKLELMLEDLIKRLGGSEKKVDINNSYEIKTDYIIKSPLYNKFS